MLCGYMAQRGRLYDCAPASYLLEALKKQAGIMLIILQQLDIL